MASGRVPTPAGHLLSNHYSVTRDGYYRQLDASSREHAGDPIPFLTYAVGGLVDELREQLHTVWVQLCDDRWEQYVYQQFGDASTPSHIRQRQLVLDLSKHRQPVRRGELRDLSPKVAVAYADRGEKTLTRDLNALISVTSSCWRTRGTDLGARRSLPFSPTWPRRNRNVGKRDLPAWAR